MSTWTKLDIEVMTALTCQVRVLSIPQLEWGWGMEYSKEQVAASVKKLMVAQLVTSTTWNTILPIVDDKPVFTWRPGDPKPDTWQLSKLFRSRWDRKPKNVTVYQATDSAGRLFGSRSGKVARSIEQSHDLLLADVYVRYRIYMPQLIEFWIGEDALPMAEYGVKNPDAFLFDDDWQPRRVIESAGSYSQKQVATFHEFCRVSRLPYEMW